VRSVILPGKVRLWGLPLAALPRHLKLGSWRSSTVVTITRGDGR
jgi:hypothetical protein